MLRAAAFALFCVALGFAAGPSRADPPPPDQAQPAAVAFMAQSDRLAQAGDLDGALAALDRAIELAPSDHRAFIRRGMLRLAKGDFAGASADLDTALELDPDKAEGHYYRAAAYAQQGDAAGAIAEYTKSLAIRASAPAFSNRAQQFASKRDIEPALADAERAVALRGSGYDYYIRATIWEAKGDAARALADLKQSLLARQPFMAASATICVVEAESGADLDRALSDCELVLATERGTTTGLGRLGRAVVRYRRGAWADAIADCEAALKVWPNMSGAYFVKALAEKQLGQSAIRDFAAAKALNATVFEDFAVWGIKP